MPVGLVSLRSTSPARVQALVAAPKLSIVYLLAGASIQLGLIGQCRHCPHVSQPSVAWIVSVARCIMAELHRAN
eukprot:6857498-Karenia_brevis.AAC.1